MTRTLRNDTDKIRLTTLFTYAPIPPAAKATGPLGAHRVGVRRGFWDGREDMFDHCAACDDGEPFEQPLPARGPSGQVEVVGDFVGVVTEISEQPL